MSVNFYEGVGRRKESTARVRIMSGSGKFVVNDKEAEVYFTRTGDMNLLLAPIHAVGENPANLDITVLVKGGGVNGQVGAVQLGVARALLVMNPDLRSTLRKAKFLTRNPRVKERKKWGHKRARRGFQFSKR